MSLPHLMRSIEQNRELFRPPVADKEVFPEGALIYEERDVADRAVRPVRPR
jgi:hypothetical protein